MLQAISNKFDYEFQNFRESENHFAIRIFIVKHICYR